MNSLCIAKSRMLPEKLDPSFLCQTFAVQVSVMLTIFRPNQDAFVAFILTRLHVWDTPPCPPLVIVRSDRLLGAEVCTEISDFAAFAFDKSAGKGVCVCIDSDCQRATMSIFCAVNVYKRQLDSNHNSKVYQLSVLEWGIFRIIFRWGRNFYSCLTILSGRQMRTEMMNDC
ncbi:hypothetical protein HNY73_021619 [Argiope bruennichi]|uniref:Uncharacterized protein n=1 Tax=Argiope bruennichi TaxID=94029 RepID=A0A8T0DY63_ARGBR|nr:hypothetical protein HNY73_021619 [Argiope bruennichi]